MEDDGGIEWWQTTGLELWQRLDYAEKLNEQVDLERKRKREEQALKGESNVGV